MAKKLKKQCRTCFTEVKAGTKRCPVCNGTEFQHLMKY